MAGMAGDDEFHDMFPQKQGGGGGGGATTLLNDEDDDAREREQLAVGTLLACVQVESVSE